MVTELLTTLPIVSGTLTVIGTSVRTVRFCELVWKPLAETLS